MKDKKKKESENPIWGTILLVLCTPVEHFQCGALRHEFIHPATTISEATGWRWTSSSPPKSYCVKENQDMFLIAIFSLCENSTKPALLFLCKWRSFLSLPSEPLLWWWGLRPALGYRNVNKMMQDTTSWLDLTFGSFFLPFLWISLTEGMNISLHSSWHSLLLQVTAKTWQKERRWMQSLAGASY